MAKYERKLRTPTSAPVKRATVRGATREETKTPLRWGRYIVALGLVFSTAFAFSQVEWQNLIEKAERAAHKPVSNIRIEGEFVFISQEKIQNLLTERLSGDFVDINLQEIKVAIEANPWINSVSIQRNWPDSLRVYITEEKPIARWDNEGFINREGKLIKANIGNMLDYLPLLSSDENKSMEIAQNYMLFAKLLNNSKLKVSGLRVDEKYSWEVYLDHGVRLKLGQGNIREKLENFLFVYDGYLKNINKKIKSIDMRYEQGMAVQWDDDPATATTELAAVQK